MSRYLCAKTGVTLKKLVQALRPLRDVTIDISGQHITATPTITDKAAEILTSLEINKGH